MNIKERSIPGGKSFRPKPVFFTSDSPQTTVIVTPWGDAAATEKIGHTILETLQSFNNGDATRISTESANMVDLAQRLKVGLALANDYVAMNENKSYWKSTYEVSVFSIFGGTLHWASVGQPSILLRTENGVSVLSAQVDAGIHLGIETPLPLGIGFERGLQVQVGQLWLPESFQILLVSSSLLPSQLLHNSGWEMETLVDVFATHNANTPTWFSLIER